MAHCIGENVNFHHPSITGFAANMPVRLLKLLSTAQTQQIEAQFEVWPLCVVTPPRFVALSYSWDNDQCERKQIIVDGQPFSLRLNVWQFMFAMCREQRWDTYFFVDAICINQNDTDEQSHQVSFMGEVYHKASEVIIWLGSIERREDCVNLQVLDSIRRSHPRAEWPRQAHQAVRYMCTRSYWQRMWIIQEILMAVKPIVYCDFIPFEWTFFEDLIADRLPDPFTPSSYSLRKTTADDKPLKDFLLGPYGHALAVIDQKKKWDEGYWLRHPYLRATNMYGYKEYTPAMKGIPIYQAMKIFGDQKCKYPQDKVWALLSVLDVAGLEPDYDKKNVWKVFEEVLKVAFETSIRDLMSHNSEAATPIRVGLLDIYDAIGHALELSPTDPRFADTVESVCKELDLPARDLMFGLIRYH